MGPQPYIYPQTIPKQFQKNFQRIPRKFQKNSQKIPQKFPKNSPKIPKKFCLTLIGRACLTCSWRFLISNELEQLELKLEKIIEILKSAGKVRKMYLENYSSIIMIY
jgi:hypothetical protein